MQNNTVVVIPARYASSRFPAKPLANILGEPMIQRVYNQVLKATKIDKVVVATDDARIFDCVLSFGGEAIMTASTHISGTDRVFEAVNVLLKNGYQPNFVLNVQGDEPLVSPELIDQMATEIQNSEFDCVTPITLINNLMDYNSPNCVKVVIDQSSAALYFSRSPIPYIRDSSLLTEEKLFFNQFKIYSHIGLYAYKFPTLKRYVELEAADLENLEALEQLRLLKNGMRIKCIETKFTSTPVDTPEDLVKVERIILNGLKKT